MSEPSLRDTPRCDHCDDTRLVWEPEAGDHGEGRDIPCQNCAASEPSLRSTAIEKAWRELDSAGRVVGPAEAAALGVDAALSVIHSQRDAIAHALKPYITCPDDGVPEDCGYCANERDLAADAVLRVLGDDP